MTSKYGRKKRSFEEEYWYVTNIDHISLKVQMTIGRLLIEVVHDRTDYSFYLPDTTCSIAKNKKDIDNKVSLYFQTFFQVDEFSFMQIHTDEENYTDYMNLYTDLIWVKNKLGLTVWNRKKFTYKY
tara:strand:- start:70 stop:447 length:378 start_codon:yes stop_codon:yes gene_type:complete